MVASGKMRAEGGAIVDALFKSVMWKASRSCEVRVNSSKYFDDELGAELMFTLGRSTCLPELLRQDIMSDHQRESLQHSKQVYIFYGSQMYSNLAVSRDETCHWMPLAYVPYFKIHAFCA